MKTPTLRLDYDLDGYDHRAAGDVLMGKALPAWQRHRFRIFAAAFVAVYGASILSHRLGHPIPTSVTLILMLVCFAALVANGVATRRRIWRTVSDSPLRQGPIRMTADDEGVTVETPFSRQTVLWPAILDVIPGPDGLLLLIGGMECLSVPARAFADKTAKAEALAFLKSRAAAARGRQ